MLHVFQKQAVFNKAPMQLMKQYPLPKDRQQAGVDEVARLLAEHSGNKYGKTHAEKLLVFDAKNEGDRRLNGYFRRSITDALLSFGNWEEGWIDYQLCPDPIG